MTNLRFTRHALAVTEERAIRREWVEAVLARPEWTEPDRLSPGVTLAFGRIAEFGDRVLRVVCDEDSTGRRECRCGRILRRNGPARPIGPAAWSGAASPGPCGPEGWQFNPSGIIQPICTETVGLRITDYGDGVDGPRSSASPCGHRSHADKVLAAPWREGAGLWETLSAMGAIHGIPMEPWRRRDDPVAA